MPDEDVLFREEQRFRQKWLWALLISDSALMTGLALWVTTVSASSGVVALIWGTWSLIGVGAPLFFLTPRLTTEVRPDGVYYQFWPLHLSPRRIGWHDIDDSKLRTYGAIREYGGWGIRWAPGSGWTYNACGNCGMQFYLWDGTKLLIGTRRPEEFARAVAAAGEETG